MAGQGRINWWGRKREKEQQQQQQEPNKMDEQAEQKPEPIITVAAVCGSLRKASNNLGLIRSGEYPLLTLISLCFLITCVSSKFIRFEWSIVSDGDMWRVRQRNGGAVHRHLGPPIREPRSGERHSIAGDCRGFPTKDSGSGLSLFCHSWVQLLHPRYSTVWE